MEYPLELFGLRDKIAVITGGLGQLGLIYLEELIRIGVKVISLDLSDKPKRKSQLLKTAIASGSAAALVCDITKRVEIERALNAIVLQFGCPHILINNAALDSPPDAPPEEVGPFETYPEESFDRVMAVNVKGTFLCCQVIGGSMALEKRGSIINVASTYGILSPNQDIYEYRRKKGEVFFKPAAYSVSKSAILNLTRYLATYWGRSGVRVNTLTPGGIFNNQPEEFLKAYCPKVPLGRMANDKEMVGAILYLASDASTYVTGTNLVVDGGWSAW